MDRREFLDRSTQAVLASALAGHAATQALAQGGAGDQVVLITGTSTGFGRAMALTFARAGYRVVATMRDPKGRNGGNANFLLDKARGENLRLRVEELDVTSGSQCASVVKGVMAQEKRIDILINNAGILVFTPTEVAPRDLWELQMRTNVFGPLDLTRLVMPIMREQKSGLVIQVSSRVGRILIPGLGLYATSKFALEAATETLHYETTPQGIDFAILEPSAFDTDVNRNARKIYANITKPMLEAQSPLGAAFHKQFLETLDRNFSGQPNRNPQELADAALSVARTPRDQRVLRYPVGDANELGAVRELNGHTASLQQTALRDSGYGGLFRD